jgi:hypothetical protein
MNGVVNKMAAIAAVGMLFLTACSDSNDKKSTSDVNAESIFFDYQVRGEEGNEAVTVLLQYRYGGENGSTLTLEEPASVQVDGETIKGDSSKITGAYYEIQKPVANFAGKHSILFTNLDKKEYQEEFTFQPMQLMTAIPETVQRGDLVLELSGMKAEDYVRVILTDTVFAGEGFERMDTVRDGRILITKDEMAALADGPIQLELINEQENPVKKGTKEGGRLSFSYGLKREFVLTK